MSGYSAILSIEPVAKGTIQKKGGLLMKEYPGVEWTDLYLWGRTVLQIAAAYDVGGYTVWRELMRAGVRSRSGRMMTVRTSWIGPTRR